MNESPLSYSARMQLDSLRYYEGFKFGKDKTMFEQEIKDAKASYEAEKAEAIEDLKSIKSSLMHYMKLFVEFNEKIEQVERKLDELDYKLNGGK